MSAKPPESERYDRETFLCRMDALENGPFTTDFDRLIRLGVVLPEPVAMDDAALATKLWEVIEQLGRMGVVLERTDHLSDRQLYSHLWHESLRAEVPDTGEDENDGVWHVDLLGTGSEADNRLYLRYYADAEARENWMIDFPEFDMPPNEDRRYDRDTRLAQLYARLDAEENGDV